MGRTSKFSFRRHNASTEQLAPSPARSPNTSDIQLSKAQRLLGTGGDLNIDFPKANGDHGWHPPNPRKPSDAAISVTISEPPTERTGNRPNGADVRKAEKEALIRTKQSASSTQLGSGRGDRSKSPSIGGRLHDNNSKETLRSHYEPHQGSVLSGKQSNTLSPSLGLKQRNGSASSASAPRSPLLHVDYVDDWGEPTPNNFNATFTSGPEQEKPKKKPSRLDLSKLFPRGKRESPASSTNASQTSLPIEGGKSSEGLRDGRPTTNDGGVLLRRTGSRGSGKSAMSAQTAPTRQKLHRNHPPGKGPHSNLYDHYDRGFDEPVPALPYKRSPAPESIPESRELQWEKPERRGMLDTPPYSMASSRGPASNDSKTALSTRSRGDSTRSRGNSTNSRNNPVPHPWDSHSVASVSSKATKNSGKSKSSNRIPAGADLSKVSILSLESSDEEDGAENENVPKILDNALLGFPSPPPLMNFPAPPSAGPTAALPPIPTNRRSKYDDEVYRQKRSSVISNNSTKTTMTTKSVPEDSRSKKRLSKFHAIPPPPPIDARISGPWAVSFPMPDALLDTNATNSEPPNKTPQAIRSDTAFQPTPPLSPSSIEFHQDPDRSSRFMAVTQQEEALLEALRQKRARMRESKMSEADSEMSVEPSRPSRSSTRSSRASHARKISNGSSRGRSHQESVLLYLDDPLMEMEEGGDEGDEFLWSDEDVTPRASYQTAVTASQVDASNITLAPAVYRRSKPRVSPVTPPNASRISHGDGAFGDMKSKKHLGGRDSEVTVAGHGDVQRILEGFGEEDVDPIWGR